MILLLAVAALLPWVHPEVGTANSFELSHGNLYPSVAVPWGMHAWSVQTSSVVTNSTKLKNWISESWFYDWKSETFRGLRMTHQPSPWMGDYGQWLFLPMTGKVDPERTNRFSVYSHQGETLRPDIYRTYLPDFDVSVELAPSCRGAVARIVFPQTDAAKVVVDAFGRGTVAANGADEVVGFVPGRGVTNHFVMAFDRVIRSVENLADGSCVVGFAPMKRGETVSVRIAASFISSDQARINLREVKDGFEAVRVRATEEWERQLGRIRVEGGTDDRRKMFYTCLYRALQFPRRFYEIDASGRIVHASPHTGRPMPGRYFAGTGFWDTFRALYPLLNFVYPEIVGEMMEGLENCWHESGWLPEWSNPGFVDCMIGQHSASVVASAYLQGVKGDYDIEELYRALVKGANGVHSEKRSVGRLGWNYYNELGYVPRDVGIGESAARTIEYAYDDYAIACLAEALGKTEDAALYRRRSGNWKNVFDRTRGWPVGRNRDGTFNPDFCEYAWGGDFTEGNALHYAWSVFHDIPGLIAAMGGRETFVRRLDEMFTRPPTAEWSAYGSRIHEVLEMQLAGTGQYAHGNQPVQHVIYLYDYVGERERLGRHIVDVADRLYRPTPDGYCGDEDNGQTSAWYVWTAIGKYPVCPVSGKFVNGVRLFDKITVNGREL